MDRRLAIDLELFSRGGLKVLEKIERQDYDVLRTRPDWPAVLRTLLLSATPVHGAWGSGRLLRTSLVSVLMTDQGTTFAGAVQPSVLYAAAAAHPH